MRRMLVFAFVFASSILCLPSVQSSVHDIGIENVYFVNRVEGTPGVTYVLQGKSLRFGVKVTNFGDFTETFNVTVGIKMYTPLHELVFTENKTVTNLPPKDSTNITDWTPWVISGNPGYKYLSYAKINPPVLGDANVGNDYLDGWNVFVSQWPVVIIDSGNWSPLNLDPPAPQTLELDFVSSVVMYPDRYIIDWGDGHVDDSGELHGLPFLGYAEHTYFDSFYSKHWSWQVLLTIFDLAEDPISSSATITVFSPSPPTVGGIVPPVDKLELLVPYIGLTSTIIAVKVVTTIYVKRVRHRKETQ